MLHSLLFPFSFIYFLFIYKYNISYRSISFLLVFILSACSPVVDLHRPNRDPHCKGILISPDRVETAAHCISGQTIVNSWNGSSITTIEYRRRDLVILKLDRSIQMPVYGLYKEPEPTTRALVTGLCPLRDQGTVVQYLGKVYAEDETREVEPGIWDTWVSLALPICPGDSGSPLISPFPTSEGWPYYGILSWGDWGQVWDGPAVPFLIPRAVIFGAEGGWSEDCLTGDLSVDRVRLVQSMESC